MRFVIALSLTILISFAAPSPPGATAQIQSGTIEGRVTEASSGLPLPGATVLIVDTQIGTATGVEGDYSIENVPVGEHTVRVKYVGYTALVQQVSVLAGQTSVADFELQASLELEELILSAAAADRIIANAMSRPVIIGPNGKRLNAMGFTTESYAHIDENDFRLVANSPLSTFSIDVDRASYSNIRRFIQEGQRPPVDAVRIEEMINYFPRTWGEVSGDHPFAVTTAVWDAPWKEEHRLVEIGLHAESVNTEDLPPSRLVFLLDVSGSMSSPDKLPLLKKAFGLLVDQLRAQDRVAIVVYAGAAGLVLRSTPGDQHETIANALCIFRLKWATDSDRSGPPIPIEVGRHSDSCGPPFRRKWATIPIEVGHPVVWSFRCSAWCVCGCRFLFSHSIQVWLFCAFCFSKSLYPCLQNDC